MRTKIEATIKKHYRAQARSEAVARRMLAKSDYAEAARWADGARSHRHVTEVLKELIGYDYRTDRR
jgi:hypothetical protein